MGALVSRLVKFVASTGLSIKTVVQIAAALLVATLVLVLWALWAWLGPVPPACVAILVATAVFKLTRPAVIPVMHTDPQLAGVLRVVAISDTHCQHSGLAVPAGDVLLHAGDFSKRGTVAEVKSFNEWLGTLPHKHKVVVAGNHDLLFDHAFYNANWKKWVPTKEDCGPGTARALLTNATAYLEHEEVVIDGVRFFGSPHQPVIPNRRMAFQYENSDAVRVWADVPRGIDVLCTHGPPKGVQDRIFIGKRVGCDALRGAVKRVKPKFHVFGHIHEAYGVQQRRNVHQRCVCRPALSRAEAAASRVRYRDAVRVWFRRTCTRGTQLAVCSGV